MAQDLNPKTAPPELTPERGPSSGRIRDVSHGGGGGGMPPGAGGFNRHLGNGALSAALFGTDLDDLGTSVRDQARLSQGVGDLGGLEGPGMDQPASARRGNGLDTTDLEEEPVAEQAPDTTALGPRPGGPPGAPTNPDDPPGGAANPPPPGSAAYTNKRRNDASSGPAIRTTVLSAQRIYNDLFHPCLNNSRQILY